MGRELGNHLPRLAQHVAMGRQEELHLVLGTHRIQIRQALQVLGHIAIGRIDDGGAAIEDVVPRKEQAIFNQQQAQMVAGMARGVQGL